MARERWTRRGFILALAGAVQFLILISIAMVFYAGGNRVNPAAPGYSIWLNSWSDLGRTIAWSGNNNLISQVLFSIAMILWAISFAPSIHAFRSFFSQSRPAVICSKFGTICAYLCTFTLGIEVVFFPEDLQLLLHVIFAFLGYLALFLVEILFALAIVTEKTPSKWQALCFLAVAVVIIPYAIFNIPILQKLVTLTLTVATILVFSAALQNTRGTTARSPPIINS